VLKPVARAQAQQEIVSTREQLHTVSRVAEACIESEAPTSEPAPLSTPVATPAPAPAYTLSADTLFAFDRADRAAMTDAGTRAIDMLVSRLSQDYSRIERVHLIGHADPLGSAERNDRLAIERALTVREHILRTGNVAAPISVEGRSSREPVVSSCGNTATPQAIACNRANRRVTVEVIGVRR
jgi:outer membrane protein OmpA-like peptidoglycan-associated protein